MLCRVARHAAVGAMVLGSLGAAARSFDGVYAGNIHCGARRDGQPLSTPFVLEVSGSKASYERKILRAGKPTGSYERGSGRVSSDGRLALNGKAAGAYPLNAHYQGRLGAVPVRLAGTQRWQLRELGVEERKCTIRLTRSAAKRR